MTQEHAKYDQEVIYGTTYDTYIYIYRKFTANSSMWGSLRLAPISYVLPRLKIDRVRHKFSGGSFIGVQAFRGVLTLAGSLPASLLQT